MKRPQAQRLPQGVELPAPRVTVRRPHPGFAPTVVTETTGALHVAHHLHRILPGANPRTVVKARKGVRGVYEPAHPWASWWHVPNEGKRSLAGGQVAVGMGLREGVSDLGFLFRLEAKRWEPAQGKGEGRGNHVPVVFAQAAFIELKRPDGGKGLSDAQVRFADHAQAVGAWFAECHSVQEVDATLRAWLAPWGLIPKPVVFP